MLPAVPLTAGDLPATTSERSLSFAGGLINRTENGPDQRLATNGLATTHDDARESFASGGSGPSRGLEFAPPPHNRMILPALRGRGQFEIDR